MGRGSVVRVNLWEAEYNKPKNDADRLVVCAAGIRAMQHFGAIGWHGGGGDNGDIAQAVAIWSRMPRQALEWKDALSRAAEIRSDEDDR
jgi:hypothetical protein